MTNAEAWFNIALRPRKPEGSLGRTAQDGHLDSHTAPELSKSTRISFRVLKLDWRDYTEEYKKTIIIIIIIDRFYIALFSAVEQTHCARVWFYMSN